VSKEIQCSIGSLQRCMSVCRLFTGCALQLDAAGNLEYVRPVLGLSKTLVRKLRWLLVMLDWRFFRNRKFNSFIHTNKCGSSGRKYRMNFDNISLSQLSGCCWWQS